MNECGQIIYLRGQTSMKHGSNQFFTEQKFPDLKDISVKDFRVHRVPIHNVHNFIETWHYSHNVNGLNVSHCFGLFYKGRLIGAMVYGSLAMANTWKRYANNNLEILELRRLVCIDEAPKNTESYFVGKTLKWLKSNTHVKLIISYADPFYGHSGIIYKASNFTFEGTTSPGRIIEYNGKRYHDKVIRNKHRGVVKPFAVKLRKALESGEAKYKDVPGKNIYLYRLRE